MRPTQILFAVPFIGTLVNGHMTMTDPVPLQDPKNPNTKSADYDYSSPLSKDGANFPCKGHIKAIGTPEGAPVASWPAGSKQSFTIGGGAAHGGGSCQAALSEDGGSTWKVMSSYVGDCPTTGQPFPFTVPSEAKSGNAVFAWTWFNKIGNREMYMNCASVTITGGSGGGLSAYPDLFTANIGNGCGTKEGTDVLFPNPGKDLVNSSKSSGPPTGNCPGGSAGASTGSGGGASASGGAGGSGSGASTSGGAGGGYGGSARPSGGAGGSGSGASASGGAGGGSGGGASTSGGAGGSGSGASASGGAGGGSGGGASTSGGAGGSGSGASASGGASGGYGGGASASGGASGGGSASASSANVSVAPPSKTAKIPAEGPSTGSSAPESPIVSSYVPSAPAPGTSMKPTTQTPAIVKPTSAAIVKSSVTTTAQGTIQTTPANDGVLVTPTAIVSKGPSIGTTAAPSYTSIGKGKCKCECNGRTFSIREF